MQIATPQWRRPVRVLHLSREQEAGNIRVWFQCHKAAGNAQDGKGDHECRRPIHFCRWIAVIKMQGMMAQAQERDDVSHASPGTPIIHS
jgi:hypothetical protein